jgi:hypothetical protein
VGICVINRAGSEGGEEIIRTLRSVSLERGSQQHVSLERCSQQSFQLKAVHRRSQTSKQYCLQERVTLGTVFTPVRVARSRAQPVCHDGDVSYFIHAL